MPRWSAERRDVPIARDVRRRASVSTCLASTCEKTRLNRKKPRTIRTFRIYRPRKLASGVTIGVTEPESRAPLPAGPGSGSLGPQASPCYPAECPHGDGRGR